MDQGRKGALPHLVLEDRQRIVLGISRMNDDRKLHFARNIDMQTEQTLLCFAIRVMPM